MPKPYHSFIFFLNQHKTFMCFKIVSNKKALLNSVISYLCLTIILFAFTQLFVLTRQK
jgi:hypothetical protein